MEQIVNSKFNDTIAAVSTPPGKGGIAIIRISGPKSPELIDKIFKSDIISEIQPRKAYYGSYYDIEGNQLDDIILTFFKAPHSFTGEDIIELSLHGSIWIQNAVMTDLINRGIRTAGPGEFSMRAFLNGKVDLAQAEGIADLIGAESKAAHDIALNQLKGNFSREFEELRERLLELASLLELELDFSEEDVEFADRKNLIFICDKLIEKIQRLANSFSLGSAIKDGIPVVIAGIPNAGKSSLLNLLSGEEKAIVTNIPGTTRDIIEDKIEINGILYRFVDTAGIHSTEDVIEKIGIEKAKEYLSKTKIIIWVMDLTVDITHQMEQLNRLLDDKDNLSLIILANKIDLVDEKELKKIKDLEEFGFIEFSTKTGQGLKELKERLDSFSREGCNTSSDVIITSSRHYESLIRSNDSLKRVHDGITAGLSADLIAQDLREAIHHLGTITSRVTTPEILQSIFSKFCIGK